jgi:hypothetical protein
MNFKTFGKFISKHGLWEKPLCEFTQEEVMKLSGAIAVANVENPKICGRCWYQGWNGLKIMCLHPDHVAEIHACVWSQICPDFSDEFDKELGPHKLNRKPRVKL